MGGWSRGSYHGAGSTNPRGPSPRRATYRTMRECFQCGPRSVKLKFSEIWLHTLQYTRLVILLNGGSSIGGAPINKNKNGIVHGPGVRSLRGELSGAFFQFTFFSRACVRLRRRHGACYVARSVERRHGIRPYASAGWQSLWCQCERFHHRLGGWHPGPWCNVRLMHSQTTMPLRVAPMEMSGNPPKDR